MIRVIVVDDEKVIRQGLGRFVKETEGFELLCTCADGVEAYDKIRESCPDLVISDIVMPDMEGLELIKKCRENGVESEFVLLSGFSEFEYARAAIQYGVLDYLNKPVNQKLLLDLLEKVRNIVEKKKHIKKRLKSSIYEKILESGEIPNEQEEIKTSEYRVLAVNSAGNTTGKDLDSRLKDSIFYCEEILKETAYEEYMVYERKGMMLVILCGIDTKEHHIEKICWELDRRAMGRGYEIFFGIGNLVDRMQEIPFSYKTAEAALYDAQYSGKRFCFFDNLSYSYKSPSRTYGVDLVGIGNAIHLGEKENVQNEVVRLAESYKKSAPAYVIYSFVLKCASMLFEKEEKEEWKNDEKELATAQNLEILLERFKRVTEDFFQIEEKQQEKRYGGTIDEVLQYISLHYMEDISIEQICKVFYFNQSYFSVLFKGKTGENYNDYITDLRIGKAKGLLRSGRYKVNEIAEMVGYNSSRYFARVFKAKTGELPKEYKDRKLKES